MASIFDILALVVREAFSGPNLARQPEPSEAMADPRQVKAFHEQGSADGALLPIYRFNALASSHLIPDGGMLVDLGSGTAQYLAYIARHRPDIRIVGYDLSESMVSVGNEALRHAGLDGRVQLRLGDMTDFADRAPGEIDMVSSVFSLHHLPTIHHLNRCSIELAKVRQKTGCAIWVFDHARPRHPLTAERFPEIFTPKASTDFRRDSRNSLIASWSFTELSQALDQGFNPGCRHVLSKYMQLYQAHWSEREAGRKASKSLWFEGVEPSDEVLREVKKLRSIFPAVALDSR